MISPSLRKTVRERSGNCCEYCRIDQAADPFFTFHVEHIVARQHGGASDEGNLAFSCHHCNLHKGPNLTGIDPDTNAVVALFHPPFQSWAEHFRLEGGAVVGLTPVGRATVRLLNMNTPARAQLRAKGPSPEGG
jgi:hypothetical protein